MLDLIRKNTKVIIWTVVVVFVLWGGFSVGTSIQKQGRIAGEVFGKSVSFQEYNRFYRAAQLFTASDKITKDPEALKKFTWQSIIYSREAKHRKIQVTDDDVRRELLNLLAAQKLENPTPKRYRMWLEATIHETPQEFEEQIREFLRVQRLITEFNSQPVQEISEADAKKIFLYEESKISAEVALFKNQAEAQAFRSKLKNSEDWKTETAKPSYEVQKPGMMTLGTWILSWGIPEETALRLFNREKGAISEPIPILEKYMIVHIADKQEADEKKFDAAAKEKYTQELSEKLKFSRFTQWNHELTVRAGLKDFITPAAPPEPEPPPAGKS